jgi:hypothetical protein
MLSQPFEVRQNFKTHRTFTTISPVNNSRSLSGFRPGYLVAICAFLFFTNEMRKDYLEKIDVKKISPLIGEDLLKTILERLVKRNDHKQIQELLHRIKNEEGFSHIKLDSYILNLLIYSKDYIGIRIIAPLLSEECLNQGHLYFKPVKRGNLELVKAMFEGGIILDSLNGFVGILLYSIYYKQNEITKFLVTEAGIDINKPYMFSLALATGENKDLTPECATHDCFTAAYYAVASNQPELLLDLISLGANCNTTNRIPRGCGIYRLTVASRDVDYDSPLICAVKLQREECLDILLSLPNIDLNVRGSLNRTPLIVATLSEQFNIARKLISKGADVNLPEC